MKIASKCTIFSGFIRSDYTSAKKAIYLKQFFQNTDLLSGKTFIKCLQNTVVQDSIPPYMYNNTPKISFIFTRKCSTL